MPDRPFHSAPAVCTVGAVVDALPQAPSRTAALQLRGAAGPVAAQVSWPATPVPGPAPPLLVYVGGDDDAAATLCSQAGCCAHDFAPRVDSGAARSSSE
jgi:hypothetical protein